jgi:hypothetical protein
MEKLGFFVLGVAVGFVLGTFGKKYAESRGELDGEKIADSVEERLSVLETALVKN